MVVDVVVEAVVVVVVDVVVEAVVVMVVDVVVEAVVVVVVDVVVEAVVVVVVVIYGMLMMKFKNLRVLLVIPPDVHVFVKKPETSSTKLTLTCLATGFYPKDVVVRLRKCKTSLPEHLLTSSGVRPNEDRTYQLRKSVEIQEDHLADYDCYVTHSSLNESIITKLGGESSYGQIGGVPVGVIIGLTVGLILGLQILLGVMIYICRRKRTSGEYRGYQYRLCQQDNHHPSVGGGGEAQRSLDQPADEETVMMDDAVPKQAGGTSNNETDNGRAEDSSLLNSINHQPKVTNGLIPE
ncbi:hypothetical protein NFI96_023149 [Prochilodus magdalenae]|nr:hypothetical protein NFI96_023149 [Prochilodus magdalenae]